MSKPKIIFQQEKCLQNIIDRYAKKERQIRACVYRLSYAGKFIIVKGKTLIGSLNQIQQGYSWYREDALKKDTFYLYRHFFKHIKETTGDHRFRIKILSRATNPYVLLKREQTEIDLSRRDPNMLNNSFEAYVPILRENTGMYGWIPPTSVMNFKKWLKSSQRAKILRSVRAAQ